MVELETVPAEKDFTDFSKNDGAEIYTDMTCQDDARLRQLIKNHLHHTGSNKAAKILADWEIYRPKFVKIMPKEYRRALTDLQTGSRPLGSVA
jgi:glutamate synthase (NADPH/NADH) large chain